MREHHHFFVSEMTEYEVRSEDPISGSNLLSDRDLSTFDRDGGLIDDWVLEQIHTLFIEPWSFKTYKNFTSNFKQALKQADLHDLHAVHNALMQSREEMHTAIQEKRFNVRARARGGFLFVQYLKWKLAMLRFSKSSDLASFMGDVARESFTVRKKRVKFDQYPKKEEVVVVKQEEEEQEEEPLRKKRSSSSMRTVSRESRTYADLKEKFRWFLVFLEAVIAGVPVVVNRILHGFAYDITDLEFRRMKIGSEARHYLLPLPEQGRLLKTLYEDRVGSLPDINGLTVYNLSPLVEQFFLFQVFIRAMVYLQNVVCIEREDYTYSASGLMYLIRLRFPRWGLILYAQRCVVDVLIHYNQKGTVISSDMKKMYSLFGIWNKRDEGGGDHREAGIVSALFHHFVELYFTSQVHWDTEAYPLLLKKVRYCRSHFQMHREYYKNYNTGCEAIEMWRLRTQRHFETSMSEETAFSTRLREISQLPILPFRRLCISPIVDCVASMLFGREEVLQFAKDDEVDSELFDLPRHDDFAELYNPEVFWNSFSREQFTTDESGESHIDVIQRVLDDSRAIPSDSPFSFVLLPGEVSSIREQRHKRLDYSSQQNVVKNAQAVTENLILDISDPSFNLDAERMPLLGNAERLIEHLGLWCVRVMKTLFHATNALYGESKLPRWLTHFESLIEKERIIIEGMLSMSQAQGGFPVTYEQQIGYLEKKYGWISNKQRLYGLDFRDGGFRLTEEDIFVFEVRDRRNIERVTWTSENPYEMGFAKEPKKQEGEKEGMGGGEETAVPLEAARFERRMTRWGKWTKPPKVQMKREQHLADVHRMIYNLSEDIPLQAIQDEENRFYNVLENVKSQWKRKRPSGFFEEEKEEHRHPQDWGEIRRGETKSLQFQRKRDESPPRQKAPQQPLDHTSSEEEEST